MKNQVNNSLFPNQACTFIIIMEYLEILGYLGLFVASFLAGSFIPFSAEAIITTLLLQGFSLSTLVQLLPLETGLVATLLSVWVISVAGI